MSGPEHFDVIVVGSGFGGSVSAFRLAAGGLSVCVLERGKAYPPGSFPRNPVDMRRNFWDPNRGLQGLFDIWSFRGLEAVMASGLGGGSLIYANVLLRKDERWFADDAPDGSLVPWPITYDQLVPHYENVEAMLQPQKLPLEHVPYSTTAKTIAFRDAARAKGLQWDLMPLAVTFANNASGNVPGAPIDAAEYANYHGLPRRTCRMCGECDIGCNDGAKNTLDHTYLSAAAHNGAQILTRTMARDIRRTESSTEKGFEVDIVALEEWDGQSVHTSQLPARTITARRVILGAGSLGSTYLLLRNQQTLGQLSPTLGSKYCGNGDLLGFMIRSKSQRLDGSSAPVITSAVRLADGLDRGISDKDERGAYIQDAGFPSFIGWMLEATQVSNTPKRVARFAWHRLLDRFRRRHLSELSAEISELLSEGLLSSRSLPLLGMGRDVPDGQMTLRDNLLEIDWTTATSRSYFKRVRNTMRAISSELDADFEDNPLWWFKRVVSVHSLGGSPMGTDVTTGVVDEFGEVFGVPGLYVVDGAAMPGPVGANPSLTIAAFADRAAEHILEQKLVEQKLLEQSK